MARTRAFSSLRRSLLLALRAERRGTPGAEEIEASRHAFRTGRRHFVRTSAGAALAAYVLPGCAERSHAGDTHVGIVGAGVAGLLCAYRLKKAGVRVTVFEADKRVGGRMFTARGKLQENQIAELGGEFIDSEHATMQRLARELGLELDDLKSYPKDTLEDTYYFGGKHVPEAQLVEAFRPLAKRMQKDLAASEKSDEAFAKLDAQSISEWLASVPDLDPTLDAVLRAAYVGEYGLEADEQSVFNLLWLIDSEEPEPFHIFGDSDERFHTHLGSAAFPEALAKKLGDVVQLDRKLVRARKQDSGKLQLTLDRDGKSIERDFDKIVLALPWTVLRSVELDLDLPKDKRTMIRELGYGTNTKIMGQTTSRVWLKENHASGSSFSDTPAQCTWDTARGQSGKSGVMTVFLGGEAGLAANAGTPEERMLSFLPSLELIFPGTQSAYRAGSALRMHWPSAPNALGSFACYRPGQAQWSGTEGNAVGHVHFAGEHTSEDFQGYMEGAAESGERVADEIFKDLGLT